MALQPFIGPWPHIQFRNHFFTRAVGTPWMSDQPVARSLPTHRTTQTIEAYTNIHALSGIQTHDPSFRATENRSCLRPHDHCDRQLLYSDVYI
jgi:hypothetical protein